MLCLLLSVVLMKCLRAHSEETANILSGTLSTISIYIISHLTLSKLIVKNALVWMRILSFPLFKCTDVPCITTGDLCKVAVGLFGYLRSHSVCLSHFMLEEEE